MRDVGGSAARDDVPSAIVCDCEFEDLCGRGVEGSACISRVDDSDFVDDWISVVAADRSESSGRIESDSHFSVCGTSGNERVEIVSACGSNEVRE